MAYLLLPFVFWRSLGCTALSASRRGAFLLSLCMSREVQSWQLLQLGSWLSAQQRLLPACSFSLRDKPATPSLPAPPHPWPMFTHTWLVIPHQVTIPHTLQESY